MPLVNTWLTHARPTAYDKAGQCVSLLPGSETSRRFAERQAELLEAREVRLVEGNPTCQDRWENCIGTYDDDEEELIKQGTNGASEVAALAPCRDRDGAVARGRPLDPMGPPP